MVREPFGAGAQIFFVLRLGGDAGEAEVFAQLRDEAGLVAFQVIEDDLHGLSKSANGTIAKTKSIEIWLV